MRSAPVWILGTAVAPVLCLTGCTSGNAPTPDRSATTSPHTTADPSGDRKLTAQVQSALNAVTEQGRSMVESGVERVSDGIHTQPALPEGRSYKLTVVCAGEGKAKIVFTPSKTAAEKTVPCDRSVVFERFVSSEAVRIDIQGDAQATGMIAWRINTA
jgi:hypothetical protein